MKILILGHKGMLGSDLVARLRGEHEVTGKDIEDFDITSESDCRSIIGEACPDTVINAAAYTDVDGCESDEKRCLAVNAEGVRNIALACRERNIKIVHFSTDYVFDGTKTTPYIESDLPNPINIYGRSKLQGEMYLRELSRNFILIRTAWLYGKNGKNFVKAIVEKARTVKKLEVVNDQRGSPTYTVDLSGAVKTLIEADHAGIYHITNRGTCTWYEFALKILEYAGLRDVEIRPITSDELVRKAMRPRYSVLSCRRFSSDSHKIMRFWQIALKDYMDLPGS